MEHSEMTFTPAGDSLQMWTWPTTNTPIHTTYYSTAPRFAIILVGRDLVKLDTATGDTWQKDWIDENWRPITNG